MNLFNRFKSLFESSTPSPAIQPLDYAPRPLVYPSAVYAIPTLVISYFPVKNGRIDRAITGDVDAARAKGLGLVQ